MKTHTKLTLACALALGANIASPAVAQDGESEASQAAEQSPIQARAEQIVALINGEGDPEEIFTAGFLEQFPPEQLATLSQQLTAQFGAALGVEEVNPPTGNRSALAIRMERAIGRGGLAIDPNDDNKVSELLFQSFEPVGDTPAKITADLEALPGNVSAWFGPLDGSTPVISLAPDTQMPLGSTFKLYVLATLAREIEDGKRSWNDTVTLSGTRSFPSGMMQDWPADAPVTLHTLASMMISISDNTATDALITELGRDAVFQTLVDSGHVQPELTAPFLTTREMFLLKGGPAERLAAYRAGTPEERLEILYAIEDVAVAVSQIQSAFSAGPVAIDVEWYASAPDLAGLFRLMRAEANEGAFDVMAINPSMPANARENWSYAGYKGGSEPGVLNLTWLLTDKDGRDHILFLSWSNEEANLDETALELIAQRILSLPQ